MACAWIVRKQNQLTYFSTPVWCSVAPGLDPNYQIEMSVINKGSGVHTVTVEKACIKLNQVSNNAQVARVLWVLLQGSVSLRSNLVHFACIAALELLLNCSCRRREQLRVSNSNAGKMDQTWSMYHCQQCGWLLGIMRASETIVLPWRKMFRWIVLPFLDLLK